MPRLLHSLALAVLSSLVVPSLATGKVNLYWGQSGDRTLSEVCQQDGVEFITLSFINEAPEQDGTSNYPGMEFAAHCPGTTYPGVDGTASDLIKGCTDIQEGIPVCQALGTKIILSIGGVFDTTLANYNVTTEENGRYFADFMWGAFGPYNASFGGPRPFDISATEHNSVDGFDFDIEAVFPSEAPWIAMIDQLRSYWGSSSRYVITGAPQCPIVSDPTLPMKQMMIHAQFDIIWIQFYNNPECDGTTDNFNFGQWVEFLPGTRSAHAKLYIGLPADEGASGYLDYAALSSILNTYGTSPYFGGVMLWDEYLSFLNTNASSSTTEPYVDVVKQLLAAVTATPTSSASSSSSSSSAGPSPTSCTNAYLVKPTDDCYDIAAAHDTTIAQILSLNPELDSYCDLTPGQLLCLPLSCTKHYTVQSRDTCSAIDSKFGITYAQLQELNPNVFNADCTDLAVGQILCVSTSPASNTTSSASLSASSTSSGGAPSSTPSATCDAHYTVKAGDSCYAIDTLYNIDFAELQALNPGVINNDCTNLHPGQVLCVSAASTTSASASASSTSSSSSAPSSTPSTSCKKQYTVKGGDSCYTIDTLYNIDFAELQSLNPGVINKDCTNLQIGQVLCVSSGSTTSASASVSSISSSSSSSAPSSTPSTSCQKHYTVKAGDSCYTIGTLYGIDFSELQALNPGVINKDCTNLQIGQVLCVSSPSATSASSSSVLPSSVLPSSVAPSSTPSTTPCSKQYTVRAGDSCYAIDTLYGIDFAELQALNPGVIDPDCANLQIGQILCVGSKSPVSSSSASASMSSTFVSSTFVSSTPWATSMPGTGYSSWTTRVSSSLSYSWSNSTMASSTAN